MQKHAYLIMAHNEYGILKKSITLLDDSRNDIYVHIDKNSTDFKLDDFTGITKAAGLVFIERQPLYWGSYSLVECELSLLKIATQEYHEYYHLLSGVDLPLKSQDRIHDYFNEHNGEEFLSFNDEILSRKSFWDRVKYYHVFQEKVGRGKKGNPLVTLNKVLLKIQEAIGIDRVGRIRDRIHKGDQWFSITHEFACYVLSRESEIRRINRFTICPSEVFLHTTAWNSPFKEKIVDNSLRKIDWKRGRPYTYRLEDFDLLMNSRALWARKFSEKVDAGIIDLIFNKLSR